MTGMRRERLESSHGPYSRRCLVSRPESGEINGIVMVLHGAGATAAWMFQEVGLEEWAGKYRCMLVFPEATRTRMERPPHLLENTPCWEDGSLRRLPKPAPGADDLGWLEGLLENLSQGKKIPVIMAGFSNGASMALKMSAYGRTGINGVIAIGGYARAELPVSLAPVPTVFIHGRLDPIVPPQGGWVKTPWQPEGYAIPSMAEAVGSWAGLMGATQTRSTKHAGYEETWFGAPSGANLVRWVMLDQLGHHWPCGKGQWESEAMGPRLDKGPVRVQDELTRLLS